MVGEWNSTYEYLKKKQDNMLRDLHSRIAAKEDEFDEYKEAALDEKRELRRQLEEMKLKHSEDVEQLKEDYQKRIATENREHEGQVLSLRDQVRHRDAELESTRKELEQVRTKFNETHSHDSKVIEELKKQVDDYEGLIHKYKHICSFSVTSG